MVADTTSGAPRWWPYASDEWAVFHGALRWAMDVRGEPLPSPLGPTLTVGRTALALDRLAEQLHRQPTARWPAVAARYLADHDTRAADDPAPDIGAARAQLLPRDAVPDGVQIKVNLAYDLIGTIAVVDPSGERWATADDLAAWNVSAARAWGTAVTNMQHDSVDVSQQGAVSTVIGTQRLDVSGHALRLAQLHPRPAPDGFVVGVPHPAVVLFTPVEGVDWVGVLRELPSILAGLYGGQFGALSREAYWVADGRWERVIIENKGTDLSIGGSERFNAVFDRVVQAATGR